MPKLLKRITTLDGAGKPRLVLRLEWTRDRPRLGEPPSGRTMGEVYLALREGGEVIELDPDNFKVLATGEMLVRHDGAETAAAEGVVSRLAQLAAEADSTESR